MSSVRWISALCCVVILWSFTIGHAAGQYLETRFERAMYRAQGGVDIALDPSTPANGALGGGLKMNILTIDTYATVSEGRRAYKLGYDIWDSEFPNRLETEDDLQQIEREINEIAGRIAGETFLLELHTRIDLLNFMINKGPWTVQFGAYAEFLSGSNFEFPEKLELIQTPEDTYIDIGRSRRLLSAGGRGDAGFALGVGYAIPFAENNIQWSLGGRIRGFYRFSMPEHTVHLDAQIRDETNVQYPRDLEFQHGWGVGLDFYTTLHFAEDLTGFRVAAYVEDLVTVVARGDKSFFVPPRFGLGFAWISPDGNFTVGTDLERIETFRPKWQPTWQTGLSYRLGNDRFSVIPKAGFILNHRNIVNADISPAITGGLEFNLAVMRLVGVAEYHTANGAVNVAVSLGFGL